jgi:dihydropteroate synthase
MGIVNVNDDSFCGDGTLDVQFALSQARAMVAAGADVIDVGAESARTNRAAISAPEEIARLLPFMAGFQATQWPAAADDVQVWPPLLSINTWRTEVIARVLPEGADILNDLSALPEATHARLCHQYGTALLIMHSKGAPKVAHTHVAYEDIWAELVSFFTKKIALAATAGLGKSQLILDPGIDFAKQRGDNLRIYAELNCLVALGAPVLLPVSRKSVIGHVLGIADPTERDAGTIACIEAGMEHGAHLFRVHNVAASYQAVKALQWLCR